MMQKKENRTTRIVKHFAEPFPCRFSDRFVHSDHVPQSSSANAFNKITEWKSKIILFRAFLRLSPTTTVTNKNLLIRFDEVATFAQRWANKYRSSVAALSRAICQAPGHRYSFKSSKKGDIWSCKSEHQVMTRLEGDLREGLRGLELGLIGATALTWAWCPALERALKNDLKSGLWHSGTLAQVVLPNL